MVRYVNSTHTGLFVWISRGSCSKVPERVTIRAAQPSARLSEEIASQRALRGSLRGLCGGPLWGFCGVTLCLWPSGTVGSCLDSNNYDRTKRARPSHLTTSPSSGTSKVWRLELELPLRDAKGELPGLEIWTKSKPLSCPVLARYHWGRNYYIINSKPIL